MSLNPLLEFLGFEPSKPKRDTPKKSVASAPPKKKKVKKRAPRSVDKKNLEKAHAWQRKQRGLEKAGKPHKQVGRPKRKVSTSRSAAGRHNCGVAYADFQFSLNELGEHLDSVNPDVFREGASPTDRQTANSLYEGLTKSLDRLRTACGCITDGKGTCTFTPEKTYAGFRELLPQLQKALEQKDSQEALRITQELDTQFDWLTESARKG